MNLYRDSILVFCAYFFVVLITYYVGGTFRDLTFALLFILFLRSEDNAFWIALFLIFKFSPGHLFSDLDVGHELPNFLEGRIEYSDFLVILFLVKSLVIRGTRKFKLDAPLYIFIGYSFILFFSSSIEDLTLIKGLRALKFLLYFSLLFSIPRLLKDVGAYLRVLNVFLTFSIFVFISQVYLIINVSHINSLFGGSLNVEGTGVAFSNYENVSILRPLYSSHLLLLNLFTYFFYRLSGDPDVLKYRYKYIDVLGLLSYLSLLISATRGYMLSATILMIGIILFTFGRDLTKLLKTGLTIIILLIFLLSFDQIYDQLDKAFFRFSSVADIFGGDDTAGGTLIRITKRLPLVMEKFWQKPILGWGFSNEFFDYYDGHVAWPTVIMSGGLIGGLIALVFTIYLLVKPFILYRYYKLREFISFGFIFLAFVSVQTTTFIVYHFLIGMANSLLFLFILSFFIAYQQRILATKNKIQ